MARTPVLPLAGVVVALGLAGCAASPLYVPSSHRGTVGEIPRDGNGEPMWEAIPRPLYIPPAPFVPPAPGIPITGPGVAEMRAPPPPPVYTLPPAYAAPNAPVPVTGPGVAEMRAAPPVYAPQVYAAPAYAPPAAAYAAPAAAAPGSVAAAQPLYPAPPRSSYVLSPLSPDASPSEVRKRARDRRRDCAHLRTCE